MYYLRKLSKRTSLSKIKGVEDVYEIGADLLKQELSTTKNTLSFWKCIDLGNQKETMKAILLSTTSIEASQFIIVDDKLLGKYNIDIDDTEVGCTGYKDHTDLHVNFCNITYNKIGKILQLYKEISSNVQLTPVLEKKEVKKYIMEVINDNMLDREKTRQELLNDINKYLLSSHK
ncbi:MAG: hypothetical protein U0J00_00610 [Ruminococcus bromii]|nr:hypothetical protein [Ruminococcus bromii]MEE0007122.1 hypothetical protein [Ruminococcus bromii]